MKKTVTWINDFFCLYSRTNGRHCFQAGHRTHCIQRGGRLAEMQRNDALYRHILPDKRGRPRSDTAFSCRHSNAREIPLWKRPLGWSCQAIKNNAVR